MSTPSLPPDDYEVRRMTYADGRVEDVTIRKSDGKRVSARTPASVRGPRPHVMIMDEAQHFDPGTGEIIEAYDASGVIYTPLVIPGTGWFWRCGACYAVIDGGGSSNRPDPVNAHAHSQGAHPSTPSKTGTMLTMDRGDLAAAIKDWADTQEVGRCDPHALADLIRDTKWPFE